MPAEAEHEEFGVAMSKEDLVDGLAHFFVLNSHGLLQREVLDGLFTLGHIGLLYGVTL